MRQRRAGHLHSYAGIGTIGVSLLLIDPGPEHPRLLWNASSSVPTGLYWVSRSAPAPCDLVALRLAPAWAELAHQRGYLPRRALLLKRVAARAGAQVCNDGTGLSIDGEQRAHVAARDHSGRALPAWLGCMTLGETDMLVLGDTVDSFDARYFGLIARDAVVGRAIRLWPR